MDGEREKIQCDEHLLYFVRCADEYFCNLQAEGCIFPISHGFVGMFNKKDCPRIVYIPYIFPRA